MVRVYYAFLPDDFVAGDIKVMPREWQKYLLSINDEKRRAQSFFARKLLLRALSDSGVKVREFCEEKNGKWLIKESCGGKPDFSLSHSYNLVVAATSFRGKIGVDGELVSDKILKIKSKLTDNIEETSAENLTELWTVRESVFKSGVKTSFIKKTTVCDGEKKFVVCVAGENEKEINGATFCEIKDLYVHRNT